jgi:hypothetical protein
MSLLQVLEAATQDTKYSKVLCVVCVCVRERERERKGWIKGGREGESARAPERDRDREKRGRIY